MAYSTNTNRPHKHPAFQKTVGGLLKTIFLNVFTTKSSFHTRLEFAFLAN